MNQPSKYGFKQFDYVQISDEELDALFNTDGVLLQYADDALRFNQNITTNEERVLSLNEELTKLALREAEVLGQLRDLDRQKREVRGQISSCVSQQHMLRRKIKERDTRSDERRRQIYKMELAKRLKALGRDITNKTKRKYETVQSIKRGMVCSTPDQWKEAFPEDPLLGGGQAPGEGSQT